MNEESPLEDALLSLAFSLHSNRGAYAMLIGAGVSASSGILTAWEVLEDLVGRVADVHNEQPGDVVDWYRDRFGEEPTYQRVLERLAPTQIERQSTPPWREAAHDLYDAALKFVLSDSRIHSGIVGMRWPHEVADNLALLDSWEPSIDLAQMPRVTFGVYQADDAATEHSTTAPAAD